MNEKNKTHLPFLYYRDELRLDVIEGRIITADQNLWLFVEPTWKQRGQVHAGMLRGK